MNRGLLAVTLAAVALLTGAPRTAQAWSAIRCNSDPTQMIHYPGSGAPWPLVMRDNLTPGSGGRQAVEESVVLWNSIVGAYDVLNVNKDGYKKCKAPDYAGFGVVGVDDGTCSETLGFDWWGEGANGVRQYWVNNCEIVNTTLYANPRNPDSKEEIGDVMAHELGHHMNYAHNWFGVSVMGYGVNMYWYLTGEDQGYLRTRYPSGAKAGADLQIHRTVLLTALGQPISPNMQSQTTAPDPTCSTGDCQNLTAGSKIRVMLTYENAGDADTDQPVRVSMFLGNYEIAAWEAGPMPAHSFNSYEFEGTVPANVPAGSYKMTMQVDPMNEFPAVPGPSSLRYREFDGFRVISTGNCTGDNCAATPPNGTTTTATLSVVNVAKEDAVEPVDADEGTSAGLASAGGCAVGTPRSNGADTVWWFVAATWMVVRLLRRKSASRAGATNAG